MTPCHVHVKDDLSSQLKPVSLFVWGSDSQRVLERLMFVVKGPGGFETRADDDLHTRSKMWTSGTSNIHLQMSYFNLNAFQTHEKLSKVDLSDLLGTVEKTTGATKTKKQLRNLQNRNATLELPLNKEQTEKIERSVAYEKSTKEVTNWQSIVIQNQKAEQLVFPLNQEPSGPKRVEQVVARWKAVTPLEQEIFRLLHLNKQPVLDPVLTEVEEASLMAMSLEEATIRRAELQKARALHSYYEAKAKREKKIKSRKYHRIQKKAKRKEFLKQFEERMTTDPTGALEDLKKMEMSRMEERMSLKHQNSGKWAKSKAIMAKYDESARKAMQEQLQINKDLTQKIVTVSDDEQETPEESETVPDFVNEVEPITDSVNPWMRSRIPQEEPEISCVTPDKPQISEEEEEEKEERNEEEDLLADFQRRRTLRQTEDDDLIPTAAEEQILNTCEVSREEVVGEGTVEISDSDENDSEEEEEDVSQFNTLFKLMSSEKTHEGPALTQDQQEDEEQLDEGQLRVRNMEDLEGLEVSDPLPGTAAPPLMPQPTASEPTAKKSKREIDLSEVLTKEAITIKVAMKPTVLEDEEHEEQISIIKEATRNCLMEAGLVDDKLDDLVYDKKKYLLKNVSTVEDVFVPISGEPGRRLLHVRTSFQTGKPITVTALTRQLRHPSVIISVNINHNIVQIQLHRLHLDSTCHSQQKSHTHCILGSVLNSSIFNKHITKGNVFSEVSSTVAPFIERGLQIPM
ncbi:U3 small nucleolar RNA-associated protein 14 -like protein A [Triplophysa tibetana]|uniref:U3 small nucleolar RNA-associated protein 14-like protein A n=1 Tax=Triplophysa tibetana TaxID=1572043 RepID=A0A5A9P570_9TELE|nr:U3 small nucleolar RNA-associated protein 14 -like protein A [Triplophysa tibetana]